MWASAPTVMERISPLRFAPVEMTKRAQAAALRKNRSRSDRADVGIGPYGAALTLRTLRRADRPLAAAMTASVSTAAWGLPIKGTGGRPTQEYYKSEFGRVDHRVQKRAAAGWQRPLFALGISRR